jgi:hypothetical protein
VTNGYNNIAGGAIDAIPGKAPLCERGTYCDAGVARSCLAGKYCSTEGMFTDSTSYSVDLNNIPAYDATILAGSCAAGHYCPAGSTSPVPSSKGSSILGSGDQCPTGRYCLEGTTSASSGTLCTKGSFNPGLGLI